jgi:hypothetical protein
LRPLKIVHYLQESVVEKGGEAGLRLLEALDTTRIIKNLGQFYQK